MWRECIEYYKFTTNESSHENAQNYKSKETKHTRTSKSKKIMVNETLKQNMYQSIVQYEANTYTFTWEDQKRATYRYRTKLKQTSEENNKMDEAETECWRGRE